MKEEEDLIASGLYKKEIIESIEIVSAGQALCAGK
jgi:hypothetical protein